MKKILLIDNYDSFTYNIFHSLSELRSKVEVYRNDKISLEQISKRKFDKIVISPGPGHPNSSGICINVVKEFYKKIPILGICLGHQIIGAAFGGIIKRNRADVNQLADFGDTLRYLVNTFLREWLHKTMKSKKR